MCVSMQVKLDMPQASAICGLDNVDWFPDAASRMCAGVTWTAELLGTDVAMRRLYEQASLHSGVYITGQKRAGAAVRYVGVDT